MILKNINVRFSIHDVVFYGSILSHRKHNVIPYESIQDLYSCIKEVINLCEYRTSVGKIVTPCVINADVIEKVFCQLRCTYSGASTNPDASHYRYRFIQFTKLCYYHWWCFTFIFLHLLTRNNTQEATAWGMYAELENKTPQKQRTVGKFKVLFYELARLSTTGSAQHIGSVSF